MRLRLPLPLLLTISLICHGVALRAAAPIDALAYYNSPGMGEAELLAGFDPQRLVPLNQVALNDWGFPNLVQEPSPDSASWRPSRRLRH